MVAFDTYRGDRLTPEPPGSPRNWGVTHAHRKDTIVLSHGHYDHTGGLRFALGRAPGARLFLHPEALKARYKGGDGQGREIGLASVTESELRQKERRIAWTTGPIEVVTGIWVTGEIPRRIEFEDTGGEFYLDSGLTRRDPIIDDQALWIDTGAGLVVVLGCAHAGVINTLQYIHKLAHRPILAVIGGMHLLNASPTRLARTIEALRDRDIQVLAPGHCTGERAVSDLQASFPGRISDCSVGRQWTFSGKGVST